MAAKKPAAKAPAKEAKAEAPPKAVKATPAAMGAKSPVAKKAKEPPKGTRVVREAKASPQKRAVAPKGVAATPAVIEIETLCFDRDRMVAEAAYYRAERRGFSPGAELEDWLEAEAEIDRLLGR